MPSYLLPDAKNSCSFMEEIAQMVERHLIVEVWIRSPLSIFYFWRLNTMEDIMRIQSAFLRSVIAQAISKTARKQGYKSTAVKLNDIFAVYSETEKKVHLHLDIDAELSKEDLMALLKQAGVL